MQSNFITLPYQSFVCSICFEFPTDVIECTTCCQLFCLECIYAWFNKSSIYNCPFRCDFGSLRRVSGALQKIIQAAALKNSLEKHAKKSEEDMDIVKEVKIDLHKLMQNRDKLLIEAAKNWLVSVYKP